MLLAEQSEFVRREVRAVAAPAEPLDVIQHGGSDQASYHPMRLLAAGVPLTLLIDLALPSGPDSRQIAAVERPPAMSGLVAAQ